MRELQYELSREKTSQLCQLSLSLFPFISARSHNAGQGWTTLA
jgi:hypothetical protein